MLEQTYWCRGIPRAIVDRAIEGSICFGAYKAGAQIGFARLITDEATFAYLADVFIVEEERGRGYGKALVGQILEVAAGYGLRRTLLATRDAHELYRPYGFTALEKPGTFMEINRKDLYLDPSRA